MNLETLLSLKDASIPSGKDNLLPLHSILRFYKDTDDISIPDFREYEQEVDQGILSVSDVSQEKIRYILDITLNATQSIVSLFIKYHRYLDHLTYIEQENKLLLSFSQYIDSDLSCIYLEFPDTRDSFNIRILQILFSKDSYIAEKHTLDVSLKK